MKYVMFKEGTFVIIPDTMNHSDCASIGTPISAGSCCISKGNDENRLVGSSYKVDCWGKSHTLKLESRPVDGAIMSIGLC